VPPAAAQIRSDLRGVFHGDLHFDNPTRGLYSTDASPFQITPLGVAIPSSPRDLQSLISYAFENQIRLIPRGGGTGLSGESLGDGLIIDLSVHFREILAQGPDWVTVQAGVTLANLNRTLARSGRRFAPNPANENSCTIGGMIGTNASGASAFRHGYTRDHTLGLDVIWDDGSTDRIGMVPDAEGKHSPNARTIEIRSQTAALLAANRVLIEQRRPKSKFNRCGYVLHDLLTAGGLDLAKLLVGTEGTFAFITAATLRTIPLAGGTALAVLGFDSMDDAVRTGLSLRGAEGIVACDLLDQRLLALSRITQSSQAIGFLPPLIAAALILTFEAESEDEASHLGQRAISTTLKHASGRVLARPSCEPNAVDRIRRFRSSAVSTMTALRGGPRPIACIEDVGVPAEELPRFLSDVRRILQQRGITASVLSHVLTGQVHTRPFIDLENPSDREKLWPLAETVHGLALSLGGTVSTQHGTGLARTPWVEKQYGELMPVFHELKRIFDPKLLLNPGKIIGPDPSRPAWPLRTIASMPSSSSEAEKVTVPLLVWENSPRSEATKCNGCGDCRTSPRPTRMCPIFQAEYVESASPRAKANLVRNLFSETIEPRDGINEDMRAIAAKCVNCKMCREECRAGVDIPKLMLELKANYHQNHSLDRTDWFLARVEGLTALASNFAYTSNLLLRSRVARWIFEKIFGLSRRRRLPRFSGRTFLGLARSVRLTQRPKPQERNETPRLAYFADTFTNFFDPSIGFATVAVLRHNGFSVHVPRRQRGSGMPALVQGDHDTARDTAKKNIRLLAGLVREGFTIICSEPTAALALTQDYLHLLDEPDTRLVAENTVELTTFLWNLHQAGKLRIDFQPLDLRLGHHVPCHLKALRGPVAAPRLLELIPGVRVHTIDESCSGMAGTFGLTAANYETSLAAGQPMLEEFARPGVLFGSTECGTCRIQMQENGEKRALHPIQYLALAYGLMPEIETRLKKPLRPRVTD
jgi:FAD/FMN-containing dehydrogenase/Fe-S oxidoreductase